VLKIAVSHYYPEGPTLYVIPGAWCDMSGAVADKYTHGLKARASRRRDLLQAWSPPAVTVNSGATCTLTRDDPVAYKIGNGAAQVAERTNGAYKIAFPNDLPDVSGRGDSVLEGVDPPAVRPGLRRPCAA
jgi:hypothetical protein